MDNKSNLENKQLIDPAENLLSYHLEVAIKQLYQASGMTVTRNAVREFDGAEYGTCQFGLDRKNIVFRVAKITPIKVGQFVTIWKKPADTTMPFDSTDPVDFVIIDVTDSQNQGQFIFNRQILIEKGIMTHNGRKGKMAIRVYPPWNTPTAKQAIKTQQWQLRYFFSFNSIIKIGEVDKKELRRLFGLDEKETNKQLSLFSN